MFVRREEKWREDGNVYVSAPLPLLLYRMCHNPRQAPSRAGTEEDKMSCLLPVPPPCSTSPPLSPSPSPPPPFPQFSAAHTYGHAAIHVHTHSHLPTWLLNRLGNGFLLFNVVWSAAPEATVSESGLTVVPLTHMHVLTHIQSKEPYCAVAVH